MTLSTFFTDNPRTALGFSGGADSSYLLYAALRSRAEIRAYFVKTEFQPEFELDDAQRMAEYLGADLTVIRLSALSNPDIVPNPENRCYHCKKTIFGALKKQAESDGFTTLIDGTNASDDFSDRPGMRALSELRVRSPLRECGITKDELRGLSREAGLFTWDKPAYACLATRIPTNSPITGELLANIEKAENALFALGFTDFRARVLDGSAVKLQLPAEQILLVTENRESVLRVVKPYFPNVLLDLDGR